MKDILLEWRKYITEVGDPTLPSTSTTTTPATTTTSPVATDTTQEDEEKKQADARNKLNSLTASLNAIQKQAAELQALLTEKKKKSGGDRCTRIAKRKYDTWPSAYASGAVVRCRRGEIWKGISENATDEEIDHALLLEQQQTNKVIIYPNFQGVDYADNVSGKEVILKVSDCLGNEPNKDLNYFNTEKKDYVNKIISSAKEKGIKTFPPIKALPHPLLSGKYIVIDGNHRLGAFKIGGIKEIKANIVKEEDVFLATPENVSWQEGKTPQTIPLKDANKKGIDLKKYFTVKDLEVSSLKENLILEKWSDKYKRSIDCNNPKGFSQKAHCQGKKKNEEINLDSEIIEEELDEAKKRDYKPNFSKEKEQGLHGWFARNKGKGWINCRTGGPCGRSSADKKGGKYPACRPTKAQCKSAGKGPLRRKKSSKPISWTKKKKKD